MVESYPTSRRPALFLHLVRKEILDHVLSYRFIVLAAIGVLTVSLSLLSGYSYYQDRLADYQAALKTRDARFEQIDEADGLVYEPFYEMGHVGFREHRRPTPLSVFARGLDPDLGQSITSFPRARLSRSPVELDPILGIFPPLDLGFVVEVLAGLLVLVLTYDAICGEKAGGTLRLASSFQVRRPVLLIAKADGAVG